MKDICDKHNLLKDKGGVVRVPFLVKGEITPPPEISADKVKAAFDGFDDDTTYTKVDGAQVVREPVIDRESLKLTGEWIYQVMPGCTPGDLIESDFDKLVDGLYAMPFERVEEFLNAALKALGKNGELVQQVRDLSRQTSEHPDVYTDGAFASLPMILDASLARTMVDNELSAWGLPGSRFLDGWVDLDTEAYPGLSNIFAEGLFKDKGLFEPAPAGPSLRAMPTRQVHITAGNAPAIPIISALRAILSKSPAVIKSPYGATLPGALFALAIAAGAPDHPLTKNLSIVYWPGGDESVESAFFMPGAFDRIIVWGAPDAVQSVRQRAMFTRVVTFNPRYGISMIGREAFGDDLMKVATKASTDSMIWNQKACIASQVHYIEGSEVDANKYAEVLAGLFAEYWDGFAPQFLKRGLHGQIKRMKRGKYMNAGWRINEKDGAFMSGVVVNAGEFDIMDHPMSRLVVVRPVADLKDALRFLHHGVSTAGVYPESRRLELRDGILSRGVSNVFPLGHCERMFGGMSHDGMMVLGELVDWKNA